MPEYIRVKDSTTLMRDTESTAIVNSDIQTYMQQRIRKDNYKRQVDEINTLKKDVNDIKTLLTQLVDKLHG
jgi:hypothetical protein|tara:strand:+ start:1125 stop:1337 length:213 start_codon:yes stop_codon:yes gene_type:complete